MFQRGDINVALRIALVVAAIILSSCATHLSLAASSVLPADEKMVVGCKFVGDVQGSSGWGNLAASTGM
jgi:hypothetical protein